jgi:precorrin-6B methylase 2
MRSTLQFPRLLVALFVTALAPPAVLAQQSAAPSTEKIFEVIGVREGSTVCEIGAGAGTLSLAAAKAVGANGRVFTSELGESRVQKLRAAVEASGLARVTVVAGDVDTTNFPDEACDALFMRDVYHHFTNPARINTAIHTALKPGARVAVVDFVPPGEEAAPADRAKDGRHGVYPETVERELKDAGFESVSSERGQRWFVVVLSKPLVRASAARLNAPRGPWVSAPRPTAVLSGERSETGHAAARVQRSSRSTPWGGLPMLSRGSP